MFAAYPVLYIYSQHLALVRFTDVLLSLLPVWLGVAAVVFASLKFAPTKAPRIAGVLCGASVFLFSYNFFYFSIQRTPFIADYATTQGEILTWWIASGLIVCVAAWFIVGLKGATSFLNIAGGILLVLVTFSIFQGLQGRRDAKKLPDSGLRPGPKASSKPDIIYVILDGYGRADQLKRVFGIDNSPFLSRLRDLGFYVADESQTNYVQTQLSVASSLNMDYLPKVVDTSWTDAMRSNLNIAVDSNRVAAFLKSQGYAYMAVGSGFPYFRFDSADYAFVNRQDVPRLHSLLLDLTPWGTTYASVFGATKKRRQINLAFENTTQLVRPTGKPRFVVVHMLAPHPPFVFNADGSSRNTSANQGLWDGSHFYAAGGTEKEYQEGYRAQLGYVNAKTLELVSEAVRANPKAIVVLQGDHGSKFHLEQESLEGTDTAEVVAIFNAYRVPEQVKKELYPSISPVNTFRTILRGVFDVDLPRLPDVSFYSTWADPFKFVKIGGKDK